MAFTLRDALNYLQGERHETECLLADAKTRINRVSKALHSLPADAPNDAREAVQTAYDAAVFAMSHAVQNAEKMAGSMAIVRTAPNREYAADLHDGLVTLWTRHTAVGDGTQWTLWERTFGIPFESALNGIRWSVCEAKAVE